MRSGAPALDLPATPRRFRSGPVGSQFSERLENERDRRIKNLSSAASGRDHLAVLAFEIRGPPYGRVEETSLPLPDSSSMKVIRKAFFGQMLLAVDQTPREPRAVRRVAKSYLKASIIVPDLIETPCRSVCHPT